MSGSEISFTFERERHTWKIEDSDDLAIWGETEQDNTSKRVPDKRKPGTSRMEVVQSSSTLKRIPRPTKSTQDLESILVTHEPWTDDNGEVSDVEIWGHADNNEPKRIPDKRSPATATPIQDMRGGPSIKRMPPPMKTAEYLEGMLVDDQGEILLIAGEEMQLDEFGGAAKSDSEHFDNVISLSNLDNRFTTSEGEVFVMGGVETQLDDFGGAAKSDSETVDNAISLSNLDKRFATSNPMGRSSNIAVKRFPAHEQSI